MSSLKKIRRPDGFDDEFHALATAMMQFARKYQAAVVLLAMPEGTRHVFSATNATEEARAAMFDSFDTGEPSLVDEMRHVPKTGDA